MTEKREKKITKDNEQKAKKRVERDSKKDFKRENALLKEEIKKKDEKITEYVETLKRLQAEFENYKKRVIREQSSFLELACKNIVIKILPVLDNLERALSSAQESGDFKSFKNGVEMVYSQLVDILKKEGLEAINPVGQSFDPREHEALMQIESNEHEEGTVLEAIQKGYFLKGKVLRPAIVKVAKKPQNEESSK
ncbi:nucleotide exchange factor GrpE [Candidatus Oleimmundimicrobium sp.]|uniref:nucleotide exchange factor GrpE n=1 Tax=Candidatus Oleimmundimicrobium sp. TaxID=3060597 RepID=UPI0027249B94|nr:nucleotide exchange factor GrpE [Candidatus Oleimmundimicrobium sp.]MDO8886559.1 nucleotide exchange factor GrpE [Candidatus Oleimmundimicrobium sp.]